jgi:GT2 family glycosyltransferase
MDVSIIIVNYNTTQLLVNAINSIIAKTEEIEYEIIVADNNSPDNPKSKLIEEFSNKIICLGLPENIGFGRANNEAAKIAKGRNLFFLNSDTVVLNNAARILSDYLDEHHDVGCCGGNLVDGEGHPTHSFMRYLVPSLFDELDILFFRIPGRLLYGKNRFYNYTNKPLKVGYITGADLMIKKELFEHLHGFYPDFFMYNEETELEWRIRRMGYKIICVPEANIVHLEGKSITNRYDKIKMEYISRNIYLTKTKNKINFINMLHYLNILLRLMIFSICGNEKKKENYSLRLKIFIKINRDDFKSSD